MINRLPISGSLQSPWEFLFKTSPDYSKLKVFGCTCFPWLKPYVSSKLDGKITLCLFLGYSFQCKGYRCLDLQTHRVYISRHVVFDETTYPFHDAAQQSTKFSVANSPLPASLDLQFSIPQFKDNLQHNSAPTTSSTSCDVHSESLIESFPVPTTSESVTDITTAPATSPISRNILPMIIRSKAGIHKPKAYSAKKHPLSTTPDDYVPNTYLQASKFSHWRQGM